MLWEESIILMYIKMSINKNTKMKRKKTTKKTNGKILCEKAKKKEVSV